MNILLIIIYFLLILYSSLISVFLYLIAIIGLFKAATSFYDPYVTNNGAIPTKGIILTWKLHQQYFCEVLWRLQVISTDRLKTKYRDYIFTKRTGARRTTHISSCKTSKLTTARSLFVKRTANIVTSSLPEKCETTLSKVITFLSS